MLLDNFGIRLFLFLIIFFTWVYRDKIRLPKYLKAPNTILYGSIVLAILAFYFSKYYFKNIEPFEDSMDTIIEREKTVTITATPTTLSSPVTPNNALIEGTEYTEVLTQLFQKYQELLKKYTELKQSKNISSTECQIELAQIQAELDETKEKFETYRTKIRSAVPSYIQTNYIQKKKVKDFISGNCDFSQYDITKHPDFLNKCANPDYFDMKTHRLYQQAKGLKEYDVTKHPKFKEKCANGDYFNIRRHQDYSDPQNCPECPKSECPTSNECPECPECPTSNECPKFECPECPKSECPKAECEIHETTIIYKTENERLRAEQERLKKELITALAERPVVLTTQGCPDMTNLLSRLQKEI